MRGGGGGGGRQRNRMVVIEASIAVNKVSPSYPQPYKVISYSITI